VTAPSTDKPPRTTEARPTVALIALVVIGIGCALAQGVYEYIGYANTDLPHASLRADLWPEQPQTASPTTRPERVILVVLDGEGTSGAIPLEALANPVVATAQVPTPSLSRPGYATLATGAPPARTGIRTNRYTSPVGVDTIYERARAAGLHVVGGANLDWMQQNFEGSFARWYFEYHWDEPEKVDAAMAGALSEDADLVVLHFVEIDRAGHKSGGSSKAYKSAEASLRARLEKLLTAIDPARDAVIFTSDHGHLTGLGGHGGGEPSVTTVPLVLAGAGIRNGGAAGDVTLSSIAPTLSVLLGVAWPHDMEGAPIWSALDPGVLGPEYLDARREGWTAHRVAYERAWLAQAYRDWTSENWRGEVLGNEVSKAATVSQDASLPALMAARARTLDEIERDRRVGRTPIVALVFVPLIVLYLTGVLRGYRIAPLLALPLFGVGAVGVFLAVGMPPSLSAIATYEGFALRLAGAGLAGLLLWGSAVVWLTRGLSSATRWRAIRFHATTASLCYAAVAPAVWGLLGFSVKAPLPGDFLIFFPIVAGALGGGFVLAAGTLWLAAIVRPTRRPFDFGPAQP
jgi:hypothetical protein